MNRPFRIILAAETISVIGQQVTMVALPLTAVLMLHADAFDMGLLRGVSALPSVVFGLFAGVLMDRLPKRRVLLVANGVSAVVMALVPLSTTFHVLSLGLLVAVSFMASLIGTGESIALVSLIPSVVPEAMLARANGRFGAAMSMTGLIGPALAGVLIASFTAPGAIAVDAVSFGGAVILMAFLPSIPKVQADIGQEGSVVARLSAGFKFIWRDVTLRSVLLISIFLNFAASIFGALEALFIVGHLAVKPTWFGFALAVGGAGAVGGSVLSEAVTKRINLMTLLAVELGFFIVAFGGISALHGAPVWVSVGFAACNVIASFSSAILNVALLTYIQGTTPPTMLPRVTGVLISSFGASVPVGGLLGGIFATLVGLRVTLVSATGGVVVLFIVMMLTARDQMRQGGKMVETGDGR